MLALPADVLDAPSFGVERRVMPRTESRAIDPAALDPAAQWLLGARRPLLILGKGARWNNAFVRRIRVRDAGAFWQPPEGLA